MKKTKLLPLAMVVLMVLALLSGCGGQAAALADAASPLAVSAAGRIVLSVNPELAVDYAADGTVLGVEGLNDDGRQVSSELDGDHRGKEVRVVVGELVDLIYEDGYFETTVNGVEKNIIVKVAQGSRLPSEDFVEVIAGDVRVVVGEHGGSSAAITVGLGDYNDDYTGEEYISRDKAEEIALAQGDAEGGKVVDEGCALSGGIYEIAYLMDGKLIQSRVDAISGKVISVAQQVLEDITGNSARPGTDAAGDARDHGDAWENWGEDYGDAWESWGEDYGDAWESWGEDHGDAWEDWGESIGSHFDRHWDF